MGHDGHSATTTDRWRSRVEHWFWRVLTGLVFAGTIAMCFMPPARAAPPSAAPAGLAGRWRVALALPGGELPFGLEVRTARGVTTATLLNPPERLRAETASIAGDTLTLTFPSYDTRLVLRRTADDRLAGEAFLQRSSGPVTLAATGVRGSWRFSPSPRKPAADLTGRWAMDFGGTAGAAQKGLVQLVQTGNRVQGSVQLPSGDTRYLAGEISKDRLAMSTFDGNAATLWIATLAGGTLTGRQFTATGSKAGTPWTARQARRATIEAVAVERPGTDRLAFRFPRSNGTAVSLADARYRGKVVVVTLGGAWCPNCHDEAVFLGPYAARRQRDGLEVIGLHFEYGADADAGRPRAFRLIDNYQARYRLPYPLLLAGEPTPASTSAALPGVGPVKVYPSTLFIGRDGRLREVHVGWAGPATGALNAQAKRDFDRTVSRLLAERVPREG